MICLKCKKNIPPGKKFCSNCGSPVPGNKAEDSDTINTAITDVFSSKRYKQVQRQYESENYRQEEERIKKKQKEEERIRAYEEVKDSLERLHRGIGSCPYCGSSSYSYEKKGFSVGKAAAGAALLGPYGLLAGSAGSNRRVRVCNRCGREY